MADFQPARKRGKDTAPGVQLSVKFPTQHRQLVDMGFDQKEVQRILEQTRGDLEAATAILLGEETSQPLLQEETFQEKKNSRKGGSVVAASSAVPSPLSSVALPSNNSKEVTDSHRKMMATYKIHKCKDISNPSHDRKMCQYWHSSSDRRRNPFEFSYSCYECPNVIGGSECKDGDRCPHSHNMLERMFHPELFKISMCQRSQDGKKCDRGILCAFAHSDGDLRVSPSKLDPSLADKPPAKPVTTDIVIPEEIRERVIELIKSAGVEGVHSSDLHKKYQQKFDQTLEFSESKYAAKIKLKEMLENHPSISSVYTRGNQPVYVFSEGSISKKSGEQDVQETEISPVVSSMSVSLEIVKERLTELIKNSGSEGIYGSDLPKRYLEAYNERLEITDEHGIKLKIKDILQSQPKIIAKSNNKFQSKYCYDASRGIESTSTASKPAGKISYSAIASAAADKEKEKDKPKSVPVPVVSATKPTKKESKERELVKEAKEKEYTVETSESNPAVTIPQGKKSFAAVLAAKAQAASNIAVSTAAVVADTDNNATTSDAPELETNGTKDSPVETTGSPIAIEESKEEIPVIPQIESIAAPSTETTPIQVETVVQPPVTVPPTLVAPVSESSNMSKLVPSVSIADSPVSLPPSVFPVSDASLSSPGHDLLLFGIDKKAGDAMELPSQSIQQSKFHDLIYNLKPATTPFANTPLSPDRSRPEHSLMPPGLTKPAKSEVTNNLLAPPLVPDETARKLAQAQSQVSAMQDQINALKKELANSKSEYDNQTNQLKTTQQKLKDLEAKTDTEPLKAQLKAKEEEFSTFYMQFQEELKRNMQERFTEMNQNITWFQQIEYAIINSKCEEINRDTISREDLLQFVHLLPTIRQFCASCKQQLKYKSDLMQRPTTSFLDPYASANRGYPMTAPYQSMYDQSYFAAAGQFAYGNAYSHGGAVPQGHPCALNGCPQSGVLPCSMCYNAYYCCAEHQQ